MIQDEGLYYLYRHVRLDNNEVFYVGVGTKVKNPYTNTHREIFKRAYLKATRSSFWKNVVNKTNFRVDILIESDDYDFIEIKEQELIQLYGRKELGTGTLVNMTDGGKGQRKVFNKMHSEETKLKMSLAAKDKPKSSQHKESLIKAKKNNPNNYKGTTFHSAEVRARISSNSTSKRKIVNLETGIIYDSLTEAAFSENMSIEKFTNKLKYSYKKKYLKL